MKPTPIVALLLLLAGGAPVQAHGGLFRGPSGPLPTATPAGTIGGSTTTTTTTVVGRPQVVLFPSAPPEFPFVQDRWEFWWEFNHDTHINLRPTLEKANGRPGSSTFVPLSDDEKNQVLTPAFLRALRDPDDQVRSAAVFGLARIGHERVLSYLKHALGEDPSLAVRTNAVLALGLSRIPRAVHSLRGVMFDDNAPDEMRAYAALSLGVLGTADSSATLREVLAQGQENRLPHTVRLASIYGLGLTEDPANAPFLRSQAVARHGDDEVQALIVLALGRVGDRAANSILIESLRDRQMQVRRSAAISLGVVAHPDDLDVVDALDHTARHDPDLMVRNFADLSLGRIASQGSADIVGKLRARFRSEPMNRRGYLALSLGIAGHASAMGDLMQTFRSNPAHSLQGACALGLAMLDRPEAAPLLRKAFRETKDDALQGYLAYALGRLGDQDVREDLKEILANQTSPHLLKWSAMGLALLGDSALMQRFQERLGGSPERNVRASMLHLSGLLLDRTAHEYLMEVGDDEKQGDFVRAFAVHSLGLLCERAREPAPSIYSRDHNYTMNLAFIPELYYLF